MSIGFNWFKKYKIEKEEYGIGFMKETYYNVKYLEGGNTSHSAGNIIKVQNLLKEYGNITIPYIDDDDCTEDYLKEKLIEPSIVFNICNKILKDTKVDEVDMRDRIEYFKELSEKGYYLTYDYE